MSKRNRGRTRTKGKPKTGSVSFKPCRKTRTRKPKYLSLVHLDENQPLISFIQKNRRSNVENRVKQRKLNNLFPVRSESGRIFLGEDEDDGRDMDTHYDNVSLLFDTTEEDNVRAITLNGLLDDDNGSSDFCYKNETTTTTSEESPLSPSSLTYGYCVEDRDPTRSAVAALVRTAMKGITKEEGEEKWVVYSEVVEKKEMEEVSSCGGGDGGAWWCNTSRKKTKLLALKLDYEEIMNAWSDKGPLYIEGEPPQTVPDLHVRS